MNFPKSSYTPTKSEKIQFWREALAGTDFANYNLEFKKVLTNNHIHPFSSQLLNGPLLVELYLDNFELVAGPRKLYYIPPYAEAKTLYAEGTASNGQNIIKVPLQNLQVAFEVTTSNDFPASQVAHVPIPMNPPAGAPFSDSSQFSPSLPPSKPYSQETPFDRAVKENQHRIQKSPLTSDFMNNLASTLSIGDMLALSYKNSAFATSEIIRQSIDNLNKTLFS